MNTAILWRLVWKEYRQQRALWTAIALAGVTFQVAAFIYCSLNGVPELTNSLFTIALSVPALYSLGCGAALFAGEHEAGTFPFQQSLPVPARRVLFAKFAWAIVSALLLFPVLWLLAFALAGWQLPDARWHLWLWAGGIVATIEVLIWAMLGSLVLRRVLPAAVVSGVTAVVLGYGSLALMIAFGDLFERSTNAYFSTLPLRSGLALCALGIAIKFGLQWFDERPVRWTSVAAQRRGFTAVTQRPVIFASGFTAWTRLVWHEWRQARTTMLCCTLGYVVLGTWMAFPQYRIEAYLMLLPVLATLYGASVFAADQRQGQYQFFTEHGVRPRLVWLSRQSVWGIAFAITAAAAALLQLLKWPLERHELHLIGSLVGFAILAFASSQLCSIFIRSGIVAVFTAALCSVLLAIWFAFMLNMGVLWQISALPLPFIFFGASWLYVPKWLQQRHTWPVRVVAAATIIVPLLSVVAATAAYRVYEIPAITLSFNPAVLQPDDSPAARETAAMYRQADQILRRRLTTNSADDSTEVSSRDDERQKGIELFLAASQRDSCHFYHWYDEGPGSPFDGQQLTRAVLDEAQARTAAEDLQAAAQLHAGLLNLAAHYYHQHHETWYRHKGMAVEQELFLVLPEWANHERLTTERLQEALSHLRRWSAENRPDWQASLIEHRQNVLKFIALDDQIMDKYYGMDKISRRGFQTLGILLPWERARMSRLLDVYTETEVQGMRQIRARGPRIPPSAQEKLPWDASLTLSNGQPRLIRSTDVESWFMTTRWLHMTSALTAPSFVAWEKQCQVRRNAVQQQLALIAWRKAHADLPASLQQLEGAPFKSLPLDPYTEQPFVYFPHGVEEEVREDVDAAAAGMGAMQAEGGDIRARGISPLKSRLVQSEPFLWSPGERLRYAPGTYRGPARPPRPSDFRDQNGNTLSESDLLHYGLRYPIPVAREQPADSASEADALPRDE